MDKRIKEDKIKIEGGEIPIILYFHEDEDFEEDSYYYCEVDGVEWFETDAEHHALILFELLSKGVTDYMHFVKTGN